MIEPQDRLEFASDEWVAAAGDLLRKAVAERAPELDGVRFSMCERFDEAPPHLKRPNHVAAWHARFDGADVTVGVGVGVGVGVADDADLLISGRYSDVLPIARTVYAGDAGTRVRAFRESAHRSGKGSFVMKGDLPAGPLLPVLDALHDGLARRTVDNPDLVHRLRGLGLDGHVADLRERGYTILENAISPAFADELRAEILLVVNEGPTQTAAMLLERGRLFEEAIQHPWVMALAEHLCGKGFLLAQSIGVVRGAGPGLGVHSDYNLMREPFPAYPQACTTIFALEDFTLEAGPTILVPGSHHQARHPKPGEGDPLAIPIEMPKGSIALWNGATWHGSRERTASGERVTLHNTYSRMTLRTYDFYRDIDPQVLERNPPDVTTLAGLDDIFEKNTYHGPQFKKLIHGHQIFRT